MQTGFIKGLKPQFIKRLAMLMGICYLLSPLQRQIITVVHAVSHAIEMPNSVLTHSPISESKKATHQIHEHEIYSENHEHILIELIDLVFSASDQDNDSNESLATVLKVDKHITSYAYRNLIAFRTSLEHNFPKPSPKVDKGHLKTKEKPPKYFLG